VKKEKKKKGEKEKEITKTIHSRYRSQRHMLSHLSETCCLTHSRLLLPPPRLEEADSEERIRTLE